VVGASAAVAPDGAEGGNEVAADGDDAACEGNDKAAFGVAAEPPPE
jgi:hypothetical protein